MNKIKNLSEGAFLKLLFAFVGVAFLIAAVCMPDRSTMFSGLWKILSSTAKVSTNYFALGGYSATFLNMALVGFICTGLYCIPGRQANNAATLVTLLTVGFGSWGIHILNIWPTILGVALHCVVKGEKMGSRTNAMLFSTGLAPFMSELMVRYPYPETVGIHPSGVALALIVGVFVGYYLPAGLDNSPKIHKGFALYSAALPIGMTAFLLNGFLYKAMGVPVPDAVSDLSVADPAICNTFCIVLFVGFIVVALLMGCSPKHYIQSILSPQHVVHFGAAFGNAAMLMNAGVFGLFILAYYNLIGASFNSVTFGIIFCMLCTANSGSHPGNVWPIMLGYVVGSFGFSALSGLAGGTYAMGINAQAIAIGLCFANGLSPVTSKYGWFWGMIAAVMHFLLVTSVPNMHGGFCLYNGGFTAAVICVLLVPVLEKCVKTKAEKTATK